MQPCSPRLTAGIKSLAALAAVALLVSGCDPKPDPNVAEQTQFNWKDQVVDLEVTHSYPMLTKTVERTSHGTGTIVAPGLMLTDADVIWRAAKVSAKSDSGTEYEVERVLALDMDRNLALVGVKAPDAAAVGMLQRPEDPRSLRGKEIMAIGNMISTPAPSNAPKPQANQKNKKDGPDSVGLSVHKGIINNVTASGDHPIIFHNANIAQHAQGGPLLDDKGTTLVGLNYGLNHRYRFSMAIPAWTVDKMVATAKDNKGRAIDTAFKVDADTKLENTQKRRICLDAKTADKFVFPSHRGLDVAIHLEGEDAKSAFAYNLYYAYNRYRMHRLASSPVIKGESYLGFTTPRSGYYVIELGNISPTGSGKACADVTIGTADWEESFAQ